MITCMQVAKSYYHVFMYVFEPGLRLLIYVKL